MATLNEGFALSFLSSSSRVMGGVPIADGVFFGSGSFGTTVRIGTFRGFDGIAYRPVFHRLPPATVILMMDWSGPSTVRSTPSGVKGKLEARTTQAPVHIVSRGIALAVTRSVST